MSRRNLYNLKVKVSLLLLALILAGCQRGGPQTREAVRAGIVEHLTSKAGLDVSSMDVEIASVSFRDNEADALVSFSPKGSTDAAAGMQMKYTLASQGGKWVVKGKAESGGAHSAAPAQPGGATALPPGHPPLGGQPAPAK